MYETEAVLGAYVYELLMEITGCSLIGSEDFWQPCQISK